MAEKKSIWLTYAWEDNKDNDVDYVAQELVRKGLDVKLDRWNLTAGKRLWEQIASYIQDPTKSDGWLFYATQNSLGNEKCKEEYFYALERALKMRGEEFPLIALFPTTIDESLIPPGIKTRLYVSITDPEWKERIVASLEKRDPSIIKHLLDPYLLTIHTVNEEHRNYVIEVRPRGGTWSPFMAAIPLNEKEEVSPGISFGPAKYIPGICMLMNCGEGESPDGKYWIMFAGNEATPTQSYYISCKKMPTTLIFGVNLGSPQYIVNFSLQNR